jgi:hypothetical protein
MWQDSDDIVLPGQLISDALHHEQALNLCELEG